MTNEPTTTPCIGICSTVYGDDICRGCKRTAHEVIDWNSFLDSQKTDILSRLDDMTVEALTGAFEVHDLAQLNKSLIDLNLRHRSAQPPLSKAFRLMQYLVDELEDCTIYGITCLLDEPLKTLIHRLDDALFEMAEKQFEGAK